MKKIIISLVVIGLALYIILHFYWSHMEKDRSHFLVTYSVCNNLKAEKFELSSSADLYSIYLTDSVNFREMLYTYYYYESVNFECHGDSIIVNKFNTDEQKPKLIESKVYSFSLLKRKANYK